MLPLHRPFLQLKHWLERRDLPLFRLQLSLFTLFFNQLQSFHRPPASLLFLDYPLGLPFLICGLWRRRDVTRLWRFLLMIIFVKLWDNFFFSFLHSPPNALLFCSIMVSVSLNTIDLESDDRGAALWLDLQESWIQGFNGWVGWLLFRVVVTRGLSFSFT